MHLITSEYTVPYTHSTHTTHMNTCAKMTHIYACIHVHIHITKQEMPVAILPQPSSSQMHTPGGIVCYA